MILISLIVLRNGYLDKKITERNKTVLIKVIDCYDSGNSNYFLKFEFKGKTFVKRTKGFYCKEISGKNEIELLSNESNDRFIFLDEYETDNDFFFGSILGLFGLFVIYKGNKNRNLENVKLKE
jgi:hypothetical protein